MPEQFRRGRHHTQAAMLAEQRPKWLQSLRQLIRLRGIARQRGAGDRQCDLGKQSTDHRVPDVTTREQAGCSSSIATDSDADMGRDQYAQALNPRCGSTRVRRHRRNFDRTNIRKFGDTTMQFIAELEVRGAGVVIHHQRYGQGMGHRFIEAKNLLGR